MRSLFLGLLFITTLSLTLVFPSAATAPVSSFVSTTTSGTAPLTVQFVDSSTYSPTSWTWSFGDGGTSNTQSPLHTYTAAGTYTVTLTTRNADGSNTVSQAGYVTVTAMKVAPLASFVSAVTSGTAPLTIQFVDSSINSPTSWAWSFGDGGTSTEQNPSHTYTSAGTYTVTLTATNAGGSNTESESGYVTVSATPVIPVASFVSVLTSGSTPFTVQFVDSSTNSPTSWAWSFGDGNTSAEQNPSHIFIKAGTYTVTMTASNAAGSDTISKSGYITATEAVPIASFTSNLTSGTAPVTVQFTDTSANSPTEWSWSFGDGGTSDEQNPVYTYTSAGTYTVSLTAENSAGSNITYNSAYMTVSIIAAPVSSFTADLVTGASPLTVRFTDTSVNSPTSWYWSFGDGTFSTEQNPAHTYSYAGSFTVSLTAENSGGSQTTSRTDYVAVTSREVTQTTLPISTAVPTASSTQVETVTSMVTTATTSSGAGDSAPRQDSSLSDILVPPGIALGIIGIGCIILWAWAGRGRRGRDL